MLIHLVSRVDLKFRVLLRTCLALAVQGIASDSDALRAALNALELEGVEVPEPVFLMREIQPLRYSVYTCRAV